MLQSRPPETIALSRPFGVSAHPLEGRTVLQIVPRLDSGGAEQTTLDMAGALVEAGARALVASEGGRLVGDLQARGGVFVPFPAATKNPFAMFGASRQLRQLILRERVDLVHVRSRAPAWVALRACRAMGIPLVTTWHGADGGASAVKQRYNSVMARGDAVIANSAWTADVIRRLYPDAASRVVTIPRGVNLQRFTPAKVEPDRVRRLRDKWNVAPDERIVLVPARLVRRKGHLLTIEAARLLAERGMTDLTFIFAGDSATKNATVREVERVSAAAGLAGKVRCVGFCEDMPAAYLASTIAVMPSVVPESFGRVAVEAQAMGVPIVATDLGATRETVRAPPDYPDGARTGWRVKAGDAAALADGIAAVLPLRAAAREALARRARDHVAASYSVERMTGATLNVYGRLLATRSGGAGEQFG